MGEGHHLTMSDESNDLNSNLNPDPPLNTREALQALLGLIALYEKRTFVLATQVAALQTFLRIDLPIFLGTLYTRSRAREGEINIDADLTDEATAIAMDKHYDETRKSILRLRSRIESDLETYAVEAMSHEGTAEIRERIDLLERLLLDSEDGGKA